MQKKQCGILSSKECKVVQMIFLPFAAIWASTFRELIMKIVECYMSFVSEFHHTSTILLLNSEHFIPPSISNKNTLFEKGWEKLIWSRTCKMVKNWLLLSIYPPPNFLFYLLSFGKKIWRWQAHNVKNIYYYSSREK